MAKKIYEVRGTMVVNILKRVKANDEYEAMELAAELFQGVEEYVGNGGYDKLIGVCEDSESIEASSYVEWQEAYETDDDRYDTDTADDGFTYTCKLCGEEFYYENEYEFDDDDACELWDHLETDHEEEYEKIKDWTDWQMMNEYFEREDD